MRLFPGRRRQLPVPPGALRTLARIPARFHDDGCSNSPDSWVGFDFSWACRIHDWRYCTRAQALAGDPCSAEKRAKADSWFREDVRAGLPWRWRWLRWVYYLGVDLGGGGSYDTCGERYCAGASLSQARRGVCRHELPWVDPAGPPPAA